MIKTCVRPRTFAQNVVLLHTSVQAYSLKRFDHRRAKIVNRGKLPYPSEFISRVREWPKLLQNELDQQNARIQSLLVDCDRDWTVLESRGLAMGHVRITGETYDPIKGIMCSLSTIESVKNGGIPKFRFKNGAPVVLCESNTLRPIAECVFRVSRKKQMLILLDGKRNIDQLLEYALLPSQNRGAIQSLQKIIAHQFTEDAPGEELLQYAFRGKTMPSIHNDRIPAAINESLNENQARAVAAAVNRKRPFVCIQGPPGTGKTRVVAEIIRILMRKRQKILVCAPSHVAVDNAMSKTLFALQHELEDSNDSSSSSGTIINAEYFDEALMSHVRYTELVDVGKRLTKALSEKNKASISILKKEHYKLLRTLQREVYMKRFVIFSTISSSQVQLLSKCGYEPDVIIIDEAAMCVEPSAWAAILKSKRCILVGDHAQLPPIIMTQKARKAELHISLMERIVAWFPDNNLVQLLSTQYRMNESIMRWSSERFYDGRLHADESVADIRLSDISTIHPEHPLNSPLLLLNTDIDTKQRHYSSFKEESYQLSYRNIGEAEVIVQYLKILQDHGISYADIGIITPYYSQVQYIRYLLDDPNYMVATVDGFQGQEREIILFSLVRNNETSKLGFLNDTRRMNVAVTRARRQFVLVGSAKMMKSDPELNSLYKNIVNHGIVQGPLLSSSN